MSGTPQARYDILFAFPGESLELDASGEIIRDGAAVAARGFLAAFDAWWSAERIPEEPLAEIPFRGGWFVYLGYELVGEIEPTLTLPPIPHRLPVAYAVRIPAAVIRDRLSRETILVAEAEYADLLDVMAGDLLRAPAPHRQRGSCLAEPLEENASQAYLEGVRRVIDYVYAGDVFQVNLSRAWRGRLVGGLGHAVLYDRLRRSNPGPFAGLATRGKDAIVSSSPERLISVRGRGIETRPIAGTRPRGAGAGADRALSEELLAHPKERAEHIMLVDLERNDLSRVCVPGSVRVSEVMVLESYAHVHHIVSNVCGRLFDHVTPGQVIGAVFPGGTITGCPKVRCMEIIAELEGVGRGPYTGSMGYVNRDGSLDLNILIRTMVREGDQLSLRAGAGIVADSIPERELDESRDKARGLIRALERDE